MSTPEITPKAFFALRPDVKQNAHFISDFHVLYPAGSVLVLHNYYENRQKYIKLYEKSCVLEMLVVSPSRKYAAIIENGEKGQIVVYDLQTLKRRRTLNLPSDSTTNRFETVTFSHDDKYIMTITGEPDWMMVSYRWEKGKVDSTVKSNYPNNPAIATQISCSPTENNDICLSGPGLLRFLTLSETVWRQYGFQKADQLNITCSCWLSSDKILCGTFDGKLLLIDNGEIRGVFNAYSVSVISVKEKYEIGGSTSSLTLVRACSSFSGDEDKQVRALISFPKGFAYSCKVGYVHMFEKESSARYKRRNVFKIVEKEMRGTVDSDLNVVNHLSINVSHDKLLATTNRAQIYTVRLWGPDIQVAPEIPFRILGEPLHNGPIIGLSMCVWKPMFLTCGKFDRTVRLWNYETQTVEMVKQFDEDVFSVSLHPTGHFAAIGFRENLRFSTILSNDIGTCRYFPVSECPLSSFNLHGHFLAAVNVEVIDVFNYVSFENIFTLKGHSTEVLSMAWSQDDKKLVSCSLGLIIEWDMIYGKKVAEISEPDISFADVAISSDGKFIYAVGSDGLLREISDGIVLKAIDVNQKPLDRIVLSRSDVMMFSCDISGCVMSVKIPMSLPLDYSAYYYHYSRISHMKLSYDDQTLVTASVGGTLIIWKLSRTEGKTVTLDKDFSYSKDILINKVELQRKINSLKELGGKLSDLEMDHALQMRDSGNKYKENIKDMTGNFQQTIEELKEKIEQMELDQESQLIRIDQEVNELKAKQEREEMDLKNNYEAKLTLEKEKFSALSAEKDETTKNYENKISEVTESKEIATKEIINMYEGKLIDINNRLKETYEENIRLKEEHANIKKQVEEDADREIVETKTHYEKIMKQEQEKNELLKQEALNVRRKFASAQKEIVEFNHQIEVLQAEHHKHQSIIHDLEKDINDLKKEIGERDITVEDQDKSMYKLRKKIQELEKFKAVLDYKIKELRNQIDPKDREIREKKEQIEDMDKELMNLQKINISLELQLKELREKIVATEKEAAANEAKNSSSSSILRQIKIDIYNLYSNLGDFKALKDGIKDIYLKYNQDEVFIRGQIVETDLQKEFMVQREFLEKTISALQSTIKKNKETKKDDGLKVLEDNVVLVEELNVMRKQLKETIRKVRKLEGLLGLKSGKCVTPNDAFNKLQHCLKKQNMIRKEYEEITQIAWQETKELNDRIAILHDKIEDLKPDNPLTK